MSIIDPSHHIYLWHKKPHKVLFKKGRSPILMSYDPGINTTNITWAVSHATKISTFVQTEGKDNIYQFFLLSSSFSRLTPNILVTRALKRSVDEFLTCDQQPIKMIKIIHSIFFSFWFTKLHTCNLHIFWHF